MRNDYDFIAPMYDCGVRLLFGKGVSQAYTHHLRLVSSNERVLVVGGGSGRLLTSLSKGARVDYVELSGKMIMRARKYRLSDICYYQEDFFCFTSDVTYDWVLFPFFLDLFSQEEIADLLKKTETLLAGEGKLIVSDFNPPTSWRHRLLIGFSITSLRIAVSLRISRLAPIREVLSREGYESKELFLGENGFIFSGIFQKRSAF